MTRFDETLNIVEQAFGEALGHVPAAHVIRDTHGLITVVLPDDALATDSKWSEFAALLHDRLGAYSPGIRRVLVRQSDLIDTEDVLESKDKIRRESGLWFIDRLFTNQDWLREPLPGKPPMQLASAFSIKGGVGRTTALALLAWHLARQGERVIVVDLDLEAPGIGSSMLVDLPKYGLIDWLAESMTQQANSALLQDCIQRSQLADGTPGEIYVLPAFGDSTEEYIPKLGRVYVPSMSENFKTIGLAERLQSAIAQVAELHIRPTTCLLDSRAGLHDLASAAVTRLGAQVFIFARNDIQTWEAYRRLFQHLRSARSIASGGGPNDLRWKLKMVAAQADPEQSAQERWIDQCYAVWTDELYDEESTAGDPNALTFARDDEVAPHHPLFIDFDPRVRSFDLLNKDNWPRLEVVEATFGDFLKGATQILRVDSKKT